jgi:hypothetical protein
MVANSSTNRANNHARARSDGTGRLSSHTTANTSANAVTSQQQLPYKQQQQYAMRGSDSMYQPHTPILVQGERYEL